MRPMLALLLYACGPDPTPLIDRCDPTLTPVGTDDAPLGFSAREVAVILAGNLPETVLWSEMTQGETSADLSLSIALAGSPALVDYGADGACDRTGTVLRVPLAVEMTLAEGEVQASGTVDVDASALDLAHIELLGGWDLPAALSGAYAEQFEAYFEAEYASRGFTLDGTWVALARSWDQPVVDIELQASSDDARSVATAWRGSWTLHTLTDEDCLPSYGDHCACEPQCLTEAQIEIVQADGVCDLGCLEPEDWACVASEGACAVASP